MRLRKLGKTGELVPQLGFGLMRLPVIDGNSSNIDYPSAEKMVAYAIENGVNYFDTAFPYHNGMSEIFAGKTLSKIRNQVKIATKLPSWAVKKYEDFDDLVEKQLEKLCTDHIDFYLIHCLSRNLWNTLKDIGIISFMDKLRKDGRIRHIGFSFHDEPAAFIEIVDDYDWEFCQIQYNFMDINNQAGESGLLHAAKKDLGIIIMEPLLGGQLASKANDQLEAACAAVLGEHQPVERAFKFLFDYAEIGCVLSGMSNLSQVVQNISLVKDMQPNMLPPDQKTFLHDLSELYNKYRNVPCTSCKYCMPCPSNVNIPSCLSALNRLSMFNNIEGTRASYNFMPLENRASSCISCGACMKKCPQGINIVEKLLEVKAKMGS